MEPAEESLSEVSEPVEVIGEVFHGDEEDPYVDYDVVVEESVSSEHTHTEVDHYADGETYGIKEIRTNENQTLGGCSHFSGSC